VTLTRMSRHSDDMHHKVTFCSLLKQLIMKYCFNTYSNYFLKYPKILVTLNKDTLSFIRFINILQAKERNKGQIKYHTYYMRQTCKYKGSVSWGCPPSLDSSILCQCQALQVWRFQAHLMLAAAPGSGMGRSLCGGRLYPSPLPKFG